MRHISETIRPIIANAAALVDPGLVPPTRLKTFIVEGRASGVERIEASGKDWIVANNDCVEETRSMEANSVDLIVTSIPFANHYEYSPNYNDFGHTDDNDHFWSQMDFLTPELMRVLAPGRCAAIHVKDRILFGNVTGFGRPTVSPFHAEAIQHYLKHGLPPIHMPFFFEAAILSRIRSPVTSRSNWAKDSRTFSVSRPIEVVVLKACVTETKLTPPAASTRAPPTSKPSPRVRRRRGSSSSR